MNTYFGPLRTTIIVLSSALAAVAVLIGANLLLSSSREPAALPAAAPAADPTADPTADPYPLQIGHVSVHVDKRGPVPSGQSGKGDRYLYWPDLAAGQALVTVDVTIVNTAATTVPVTDTTIRLMHGPNLTPAQDVAGNGSYTPPTQVAGNGQAVLRGSFVLPAADVIGAVVYAPFPQQDGTDPDAPLQQAQITEGPT